jgi:hypothetical protein
MQRSRCAATNSRGEPCRSTIILESGYCRGHDPSYAEDRKRAAARNGLPPRDPELVEIRDGLRRLTEWVNGGDADPERVGLLVSIARTRLYAARVESDLQRHSREVEELEDYAADLEERFEELKNGHAPEAAMIRRK